MTPREKESMLSGYSAAPDEMVWTRSIFMEFRINFFSLNTLK